MRKFQVEGHFVSIPLFSEEKSFWILKLMIFFILFCLLWVYYFGSLWVWLCLLFEKGSTNFWVPVTVFSALFTIKDTRGWLFWCKIECVLENYPKMVPQGLSTLEHWRFPKNPIICGCSLEVAIDDTFCGWLLTINRP